MNEAITVLNDRSTNLLRRLERRERVLVDDMGAIYHLATYALENHGQVGWQRALELIAERAVKYSDEAGR